MGPAAALRYNAAIRARSEGMVPDGNWFTEIDEAGGTAFSLRLAERLHLEQSPYQKIEILETTRFGTLMVIDDYIMLSDRDNFLYHEMMSHPVLFSHPAPKRVVIIGGGDCGTLREVLRHPEVEHVLQVEIDERVTRLSERFFPELCEANDDPRAELYFGDGLAWMADAESGSVDVVIVDSTDPVGPAKGLFTEDFYRDVHRALGPDGLVVQQSESPLYHMHILAPMRRAMRAGGFSAVRTLCFPQPVYPSGWWSATMAGRGGEIAVARAAEAEQAPFETQYYSLDIHRAALVAPPFVRRALENADAGG